MEIPLEAFIPIVLALLSAIGWLGKENSQLHREVRTTRELADESCAAKLAAVELRVARLEKALEASFAVADDWRLRWQKEVELGVKAAAAPAGRAPLPSWEDSTDVRIQRAEIVKKATARLSSRPLPGIPTGNRAKKL